MTAATGAPRLRLRHDHVGITLAAEHLERTVDWYRDVLDLDVLHRFVAGPSTFVFLGNGEVTVELVSAGARPGPPPAPTLPGSHDVERLHHLCLGVDDLDEALRVLAERGVAVFAGPVQVDAAGRRIAFVRDPVGTVIELSQPVLRPGAAPGDGGTSSGR